MKAYEFQTLHQRDGAFVIPNPWDAGSARLLTMCGFEALATTSAGFAFSRGRTDNAMGRDAVIAHVREIAAATHLPVSADLENGFGDTPEVVAKTIAMAAKAGAAGGSIEDATQRPDQQLYPLSLAVERIHAAVEAARALSFPFILTARAEKQILNKDDLEDTICRLQAYAAAGADVLFAPGITCREDIATVVASVRTPVNVIAGSTTAGLSVRTLGAMGVKRISLGGSLARTAYGALIRAAREIQDHGSFLFTEMAISGKEINRMFAAPTIQTKQEEET